MTTTRGRAWVVVAVFGGCGGSAPAAEAVAVQTAAQADEDPGGAARRLLQRPGSAGAAAVDWDTVVVADALSSLQSLASADAERLAAFKHGAFLEFAELDVGSSAAHARAACVADHAGAEGCTAVSRSPLRLRFLTDADVAALPPAFRTTVGVVRGGRAWVVRCRTISAVVVLAGGRVVALQGPYPDPAAAPSGDEH
ncbi:MAG: hypothetical protein AAF721_26530 [Myxococcota bacterium]